MLPEGFSADYSFYDKFNSEDANGEKGTSLKLLLKDLQFCSDVQSGLEFVRVGSKPVKLNASRCFPLCRQKRTLPASATILPGADLSSIRCARRALAIEHGRDRASVMTLGHSPKARLVMT